MVLLCLWRKFLGLFAWNCSCKLIDMFFFSREMPLKHKHFMLKWKRKHFFLCKNVSILLEGKSIDLFGAPIFFVWFGKKISSLEQFFLNIYTIGPLPTSKSQHSLLTSHQSRIAIHIVVCGLFFFSLVFYPKCDD